MRDDSKVENIIRWRESLSTMKDERFFDIIRTYLGEIHTPYNKGRLIESLSAIFRKEENKRTILSFLSCFDIKILSAIFFLKNPTQNLITSFFEGEFSFSEIYSGLVSLYERMVIYVYKDKNSSEENARFSINPLLEDFFVPYMHISVLFPRPEHLIPVEEEAFVLNPQCIASFISYIRSYPDLCKKDLSIRKKDAERLENIFLKKNECLQALFNAFVNLEILRVGERGVFFDKRRLEKFAQMEECKQYAFLAGSTVVRLGRNVLRENAQLLLDIASAIPQEGFSRLALFRAALVFSGKLREDDLNSFGQGKFARILNSYNGYESNNSSQNTIIDSIIESAITLGLFVPLGKGRDGVVVYRAAECMLQNKALGNGAISQGEGVPLENSEKNSRSGLVNINAGTNISIMPGLFLHELLPLTLFMDIVSYNTVCEFEITRQSIIRAFDAGLKVDVILESLSKYSAFAIPQSLKMNVEDWYNSYSSTMLFKGYVLKVDEKNARIIERNPSLLSYIEMMLAPGIYLLNIPLEDGATTFIRESGLEFLGSVKTPETKGEAVDFPFLRQGRNLFDGATNNEFEKDCFPSAHFASEIKKQFYGKLDTLSLNEQQRECLAMRIERGVIISEEQLRADTVKMEILEADGINYAGKIRLLENAISSDCFVEIFESSDSSKENPGKYKSVVGKPLSISRHTNDSLVKMQVEPTQEVSFFSISHASKIKIIKNSMFAI